MFIPVVVIVIAAAGGLFAYSYVHSPPTQLTIYGNVDIRDVNLGFRVPGRLDKVLKDEGDAVKAGELVAVLDKRPYLDTVAERAADVEVKRAIYANADATYKRDLVILPTGGVSKQVAETDKFSLDQAKASLDMSVATLQSAQTDLRDTDIFAPSDGVIMTRAQEPGAILTNGNTVLTENLNTQVWVRAYVSETDLGHVAPGKLVEVYTDTDPKHAYHGRVGFVSPEAEFTPKSVESTELRTSLVYRLRIEVEDDNSKLRQGMPCTVKIDL